MTGDDPAGSDLTKPGASVAARDDLAGIVDLFGALTRAELRHALSELAFKQGTDADEAALDATVTEAIREYYLVPADRGAKISDNDGAGQTPAVTDDTLLVVGPTAFPSLPDNAEDLPHIMDIPDRDVDRAELGAVVRDRLRTDADAAIESDDEDRMETLLDVCYDLEIWAPIEATDVISRLDAALD